MNSSFTNSPSQCYKQKAMTDFLSSDTKLRSPIAATPPSSRKKLPRSRSSKQKGTDVKDKVKKGNKDLKIICQKGTEVKDKVKKEKNDDLCVQTVDSSVIVVHDNSLNGSVDRLDKDKKKIGNNTLIDTSIDKNKEDKKENKNKRSKRSKDKLFNRTVESPKSTLFTTKLNITNSKHDKVRKTKKLFSSDSDDEKQNSLVLDRRKSNDVLKSFPFKSHLVNLPYLSPSKLEVEGKQNKSDIEIELFGNNKLTNYKIPKKRKNNDKNDNLLLENNTRSTKECNLLVEFKRRIREDNKSSSTTKLLNKENINNSVTMASDKVKSSKVITSTPTKVEMKTGKYKPIFNSDKLTVVTSKKSNADKLSVVTTNSPEKSKIKKDNSIIKSSINQDNLKTPEKKENRRDCDKKKSPKKSGKNSKETESYKPLKVVSKSKEVNLNSPRKIDEMAEIKPEKKRKKTVLKYGMRLPSFADIKKTKQKFIEYNNNLDNVKTLQEIDLPDCKEYEINKNQSLTLRPFLDCKHLSLERLEQLFDDNKNYLILITKGEVFSERHQQFIKNPSGSNEFNMRELTYNTSMMVFSKGQKLLLANLIDGIFKDKFFTYNSQYYFKVLLPELCLMIFMNVHHMDRENATKYLQNIPTDLS